MSLRDTTLTKPWSAVGDNSTLKIAVVGLGHVGLPTALGLADLGWEVVGADDDADKVRHIARGEMPFYEPGAQALLCRQLDSQRFRATADVPAAVAAADVVFVCVGTPQRDDGSPDLSQVESVSQTIARRLNGYKLIVEKSTTPVRTAEQIKRTIGRYANGNHDFEVAVNPEFLREGRALHDFANPDRIVLGVESDRSRDLLLRIYRPLLERLAEPSGSCDLEDRVVVTDPSTAELIKHAANAFLAMKISFINLVSDLCEATGADVTQVARGLGQDPRIGHAFLRAGIGFGGYCLPKDLRAFIRIGTEQGVDVGLLTAVEHINELRTERILQKVRQAVWIPRGKTIGILGLAFKPMTDDVREAPSLKIIERLRSEGATLRLHDPQAMDNVRRLLPEEPDRLSYCSSPYDAAAGAHVILLLTEWEEYRELDFARIRQLMEVPVLIDGRNLFEPAAVRGSGLEYYSIGRP